MATLVGRYPFIMFQIANTLYDIENEKAYELPINLGNYNYSPAVMKTYTPKMGLYILDVISQNDNVKVLYAYPEKKIEYNIMEYNVTSQKVIKKAIVSEVNTESKLIDDNILRFKDYKTIVNFTKGSNTIVEYTLSE